MSGLEALLQLQDFDTLIGQLEHRLASLVERARLANVEKAIALLKDEEATVRLSRDELARDQRRIEDEVALVAEKAQEVNGTLYSGTVTSPRELQALQDDFDSLKRRQRELEDRVIAVMEQTEPVDNKLGELAASSEALDADHRAATVALAEAESSVEAELADIREQRVVAVAGVPEQLLREYEKLRVPMRGIAVARLVGAQCGGCHLTLSAVELDRIRNAPQDALQNCDECGRILVRL